MVRIAPLAQAMALVLALAAAGCSEQPAAPHSETAQLTAVAVTVTPVKSTVAVDQIEVVGTLQAVNHAQISSKITGNIVTLPIALGSTVEIGDLLVEISAREISAQVEQARAQLEQARRNLKREESLLAQKAATRESVKELRDTVRISEGAYAEALTMLDYTTITAPFKGIVTRKMASVGDLAQPGKVLLHIEDENRLQVLTDIPEAMLLKIAKGDDLPVRIPSIGQELVGTVSEVSPTADPTSRSAPIKINIPPNDRLRSGQFARVALTTGQRTTLTVPAAAVLPFGQLDRVFVAVEQTARLRIVRVGRTGPQQVEILSGLEEGEEVIVTNNAALVDGQPLLINEPQRQ